MMQLLKKLNREEGLTVILATHSVDMLPLFANRITVLDGGRVLQGGAGRGDLLPPGDDRPGETAASLRLAFDV